MPAAQTPGDSRIECPAARSVAMRQRSSRFRHRVDRVSSSKRTGGIPPHSARHRYPVLRPIPSCRHASTLPTPPSSSAQYRVSDSIRRYVLSALSGHPSSIRSVATNTRTHPPYRGWSYGLSTWPSSSWQARDALKAPREDSHLRNRSIVPLYSADTFLNENMSPYLHAYISLGSPHDTNHHGHEGNSTRRRAPTSYTSNQASQVLEAIETP